MKPLLKSYGLMTAGCLIYALGYAWFIAPNQFAMGGVTGLAQVIHFYCPPLTVGALTIVMNVPLFAVGWRKLGGHMLVSSLYSMLVSSAAMDLYAALYDFGSMDPFLACLYGGAVMGVGSGMIFAQGATTGGTDIVGRLMKLKWPWLPIGNLLLVPNLLVMLVVAAAFGTLNALLYGIVKMVVSSKVMDTILYGMENFRVAYIVSDCWQDIAGSLMQSQHRGVTILQGHGAYTGAEKQVLMIAFKQKEIVQIKRQVHDLDPEAFFIVCDAHEIVGRGFRSYQKDEI